MEECESLNTELCFTEHISVISLRICNTNEDMTCDFVSLAVVKCVAAL